MSRAQILVVDDEPDIRRLVQEILEDENYQVATAENAASARAAYEKQAPDLVLLDIWMPDTDGITLLKEWSASGVLKSPVVIMSGHGNVETAVEATRLGAYDFIEKPVSMNKLLVTVERALQTEKLKQENQRLRDGPEPVTALTGKSSMMQQLRDDIERIAATDAWVLITGAQGSGKAIAARHLHDKSARKNGPFVELSLSIPASQEVSVQLFGSGKGRNQILGGLERATGGSLLLNEIENLDVATQTKLLQALDEKSFTHIGESKTIPMDVRIIATSSQDLKQAIAEGRVLQDLYYQLNVVSLHMPNLRDHREDVPELVSFYVDWLSEKERLPYRKFTIGALNLLRNYSWPGNIRELKNLIQRLLILNDELEVDVEEVEQTLHSFNQPTAASGGTHTGAMFDIPLRQARDQFEKSYLEYHLQRTGGNVSELAEIAGMERTHLYRKLKQLGINPKQVKTIDTSKNKQ